MALDNLRGGTKRVVEETAPLNNLRGGTKRVVIVDGGGGSSYTAGTGIDITSGVVSVTAPTLTNTAGADSSLSISNVGSSQYITMSVNVGEGAKVSQSNGVAIGASADVRGAGGVAIGQQAYVTNGNNGGVAIGRSAFIGAANAIQLDASNSSSYQQNNDANTFKVANANGNFEIMSADGTVPTARLTKVNTTATLVVADWSSNTQTVTVSGVKAGSVVFVSPAPASASDYASAGILCTAQAADSLTFTATTTPSVAIVVNIVCL